MDKIAIVNDVLSVSGEKTFWNVLAEELNATTVELGKGERIPENVDIVITNSLLGRITDKQTITLLQDNYIEMYKMFGGDCLRNIVRQIESLTQKECIRIANTNHIAYTYRDVGKFNAVIPLGVDSNLFKPLNKKDDLREKYGIPTNKKVNIWVGSHHPVKGLDLIKLSNDFWIFVFKDAIDEDRFNTKCFYKVDQKTLCELYNCADQFISTSRMESQGLAAIEAMFCGIPVKYSPVGIFWDWTPNNINPRQEVFDRELDKSHMIKRWKELLCQVTTQ